MENIEEEYLIEREKNNKKLNLIDNLDSLGLSKNKKKEFIKFYYLNLDLGLEEALIKFKHEK